MLTEKLQENLFKLVHIFERLNDMNYFFFLINCARMYHNYEYFIVAEINTSEKDIIDENSDIVKIAENIINRKDIDTSEFELNQDDYEKVGIAKINNKGFKLFPSYYHESNTLDLLDIKERYVKSKYFGLNLVWIKEEFGEKKFNEYINKLTKSLYEDRLNKDQEITEYLTLDPSTFYFLNEISANSFSSGFWNGCLQIFEDGFEFRYKELKEIKNIEDIDIINYDLEFVADELFIIFHLFESSKKINFYIDARLYYEEQIFEERICSIPGYSMINKKLRGFHNGYYCPIGKSEFLKSLPYSIDVIESIRKIMDYVETCPLTEQKESVVKHVLKKFDEKGYLQQKEIWETLNKEYFKKHSEREKRNEDRLIENETILKQIFEVVKPSNEIPTFCNELNEDHQERYKAILNDIKKIQIPIVEEDISKYKDIYQRLGILVGNILTYFFYGEQNKTVDDITISNLKYREKLLSKLDESERKVLEKYSEKCGKIYDGIRHQDKIVIFWQLYNFIDFSKKVIEIIIKKKSLFKE